MTVSTRERALVRLVNKGESFFHLGLIARGGRVLARVHRGP